LSLLQYVKFVVADWFVCIKIYGNTFANSGYANSCTNLQVKASSLQPLSHLLIGYISACLWFHSRCIVRSSPIYLLNNLGSLWSLGDFSNNFALFLFVMAFECGVVDDLFVHFTAELPLVIVVVGVFESATRRIELEDSGIALMNSIVTIVLSFADSLFKATFVLAQHSVSYKWYTKIFKYSGLNNKIEEFIASNICSYKYSIVYNLI